MLVAMNQPPLWEPPPHEPGPHELAMEATLRSWADRDHLTGDDHAADRALLRALARQADRAERECSLGRMKPAQTIGILRELGAATLTHRPGPVPRSDPREAALESRALEIIDGISDTG